MAVRANDAAGAQNGDAPHHAKQGIERFPGELFPVPHGNFRQPAPFPHAGACQIVRNHAPRSVVDGPFVLLAVQARQRAQAYASAGAQDEEGPANGQEIIFPGGLLRHGCAYARFQHGSMGAVRVVPSVLDDAGEPRRAVCQRKRSRLPVREKQGKRSVDFFPVQRFPCGRDGGGGIGSWWKILSGAAGGGGRTWMGDGFLECGKLRRRAGFPEWRAGWSRPGRSRRAARPGQSAGRGTSRSAAWIPRR